MRWSSLFTDLKRRNFLSVFSSPSQSPGSKAQESSLEMCDITFAPSQSCNGSDITEATPPSPPSSAASFTVWMDDVIVSAAALSDRLTQRRSE
ncbi:hypothetical protein PBY51_003549 [Eleginops maclovinus]|uniref:Uncharacterized protein n=1 Tax=Eleginops maclovinus TaxID=56733 RepID=A0AAN7XV35_ELEMC|nr:hypothetical protein PBY51_003549 [Eleginops maclovinus]